MTTTPRFRKLYSLLLRDAGYEVEEVEHAFAAVATVVRTAPDLILADIRMPIVDGMALVKELKSHTDSRHIPIVAITGYDSPEIRDAALQAGYDGYLAKPIEPHRLLAQIVVLLHGERPDRPEKQL